jgi:hypothetical protein
VAVVVAVGPRGIRSEGRAQDLCPAAARALVIWPRLDRRELARRRCDKKRLARYISRRTTLPVGSIITLLDRS